MSPPYHKLNYSFQAPSPSLLLSCSSVVLLLSPPPLRGFLGPAYRQWRRGLLVQPAKCAAVSFAAISTLLAFICTARRLYDPPAWCRPCCYSKASFGADFGFGARSGNLLSLTSWVASLKALCCESFDLSTVSPNDIENFYINNHLRNLRARQENQR